MTAPTEMTPDPKRLIYNDPLLTPELRAVVNRWLMAEAAAHTHIVQLEGLCKALRVQLDELKRIFPNDPPH